MQERTNNNLQFLTSKSNALQYTASELRQKRRHYFDSTKKSFDVILFAITESGKLCLSRNISGNLE